MKNIIPLNIAAVEPDLYRLDCRTKDGDVSFSFPMSWKGPKEKPHRSLTYEDAYYFVTYDDPEGNTVEKCIQRFDASRQQRKKASALIPECIRIEPAFDSNVFKYVVVANSPGGQIEHLVSVSENDNTRTCKWEFGVTTATLDSKGIWTLAKDGDPLLQAILLLHQATHPKYKSDMA